jgi:predicted HTH domain antitoxin
MSSVLVKLDEDLVDLLQTLDRPVEQAARELIVLELYRQRTISSGRAAALLGMSRAAFVPYASELGIPYFELSDEEWAAERDAARLLSSGQAGQAGRE